MSQGHTPRMTEVASYLNVTFQRVAQMRMEGKLPAPDQIDRIGPLWKATLERWAEREWWDTRRWRKRPSRRSSR